MLKKIFQPKWQHNNSEIRKKAVDALSGEQTDVLKTIAQTDPQPGLRCLAVRKLSDLATLFDIQQHDGDKTVRDLAAQCVKQLLAGKNKEHAPLPLEQRLTHLDRLNPSDYRQELLIHLARHGDEMALRQHCLALIEDENVCADIAIHDNITALRLQALEKINKNELLEKISQQTRNKDKKVYRLSKERLAKKMEAEQKPLRLQAQRDEVCKQINLLLKAQDWEKSTGLFDQQQAAWQAIEGTADAQSQACYDELCQQFTQAKQQAFIQKQEQQLLLEQKQQLLQQAAQLQQQLQQKTTLSGEENQAINHALVSLDEQWHTLAHLPEKQEQQLQLDYKTHYADIQSLQRGLRHLTLVKKELEKICTDAENGLASQNIHPRHVKTLQQRWQAIEHPQQFMSLITPWMQRFDSAYAKLSVQLKTQQNRAQDNLQKLEVLVVDIETALSQGQLQQLLELEKQVQAVANTVVHHDSKQQKNLQARLHKASEDIAQLKSWQHWGNLNGLCGLCEQAEALVDCAHAPEILAKEIQALQNQWKKLAALDDSHHLWRRFNKACQTAYLPCKAHFEAKAQQRQVYEQQKAAISQQLADMVNADWSHVDWHQTYRQSQELRHAWYKMGPIDRRNKKQSLQQFQTALASLDSHFERERKRNLCFREELLQKVRALHKEDNIQQTIDAVKELQKQWQVTVPSKRTQEHQLWEAFCNACDTIFAKRKQLRQQHVHDLHENLQQKTKLCDQLEQLLTDNADRDEVQRQIHKINSQWAEMGQVPKKSLHHIQQRYEQLKHKLNNLGQQQQLKQQNQALKNLADYAAVCEVLELSNKTTADIEQAKQQWATLAPIDEADRQAIEQRFAQACQPIDDSTRQKARKTRELLVIRLEILAKVESPADALQQRMAYQVERLSKSMQGEVLAQQPEKEARQIERAWYFCPSAPAEHNARLQQRFQFAKQAFYQKDKA